MPDHKISQVCPICNKVFTSYLCKKQILCSKKCRHAWQSHKLKDRATKECATCGKQFEVTSSKRKQRYCSPDCYINRPTKYTECPICNKKMLSSRKSCSVKCMAERYKTCLVGENNPNWKGGYFSRENSGVSSRIRDIVLIRDNYKCQKCGAIDWDDKPSLLHMHHVTPFEEGGKSIESNLITLCFICHWEGEHGYRLNGAMQEIASKQNCGSKNRRS